MIDCKRTTERSPSLKMKRLVLQTEVLVPPILYGCLLPYYIQKKVDLTLPLVVVVEMLFEETCKTFFPTNISPEKIYFCRLIMQGCICLLLLEITSDLERFLIGPNEMHRLSTKINFKALKVIFLS